MNRRLALGLLITAAVALGSLREFLFVNLNYQIDHTARGTPYSYAHSTFQHWVGHWDLPALVRAKWVLAVLFTGTMLGITLAFARLCGATRRHLRVIVAAFVAIGAAALALHLFRAAAPELDVLSVKLLHMVQYPVLLFFVWAALVLGRREPVA